MARGSWLGPVHDSTQRQRRVRFRIGVVFDTTLSASKYPCQSSLSFGRFYVATVLFGVAIVSSIASYTQSMRMLHSLPIKTGSTSEMTDQLVAMDLVNISTGLTGAPSNVTAADPTLPFQSLSPNTLDFVNNVLLPTRSVDVIDLSTRHVEPPSNITAAVCFKTLFGDIDLGVVIQWAAYNALLGFDRIFMFYRPEVTELPRWHELYNLPYVVLTKQTKGSRKNYYNQAATEVMCLQEKRFAASYDWVLVADVDEYLWFSERVGIKEFLNEHRNMTYISFGKQMHSLSNRVDSAHMNKKINTTDSSLFAVSEYPFYMKHFCNSKRRKNDPICPQWWGRAKVMVRPKMHGYIQVHGTIGYDKFDGTTTKHFHPSVAHFKEWPEIFASHNITKRSPNRFTVGSQSEVNIHNMHTGFKPIGGDGGTFLVWDGRWQVEYDTHLEDWFNFVIQRAALGTYIDTTYRAEVSTVGNLSTG